MPDVILRYEKFEVSKYVFRRMGSPLFPHVKMYGTKYTGERTPPARDHRNGPFRAGIVIAWPRAAGIPGILFEFKVPLEVDQVIGGERKTVEMLDSASRPIANHPAIVFVNDPTDLIDGLFAFIPPGDLLHRELSFPDDGHIDKRGMLKIALRQDGCMRSAHNGNNPRINFLDNLDCLDGSEKLGDEGVGNADDVRCKFSYTFLHLIPGGSENVPARGILAGQRTASLDPRVVDSDLVSALLKYGGDCKDTQRDVHG
ncbi:MAG: hypothetical protein WBI10_04360 [Syntrophales bacterium]